MTVRAHLSKGVVLPRPFVNSFRVRKIVATVMRSEKKRRFGEINVVFVDRATIRRMNKQFLDTAGDTDVIAFPYENHSGDIYICGPIAIRNAKHYNEPLGRELTRLVVHGTLHLLGYADWPKKAQKKMWARQEPLVDALWRNQSS